MTGQKKATLDVKLGNGEFFTKADSEDEGNNYVQIRKCVCVFMKGDLLRRCIRRSQMLKRYANIYVHLYLCIYMYVYLYIYIKYLIYIVYILYIIYIVYQTYHTFGSVSNFSFAFCLLQNGILIQYQNL